MQTSVSPRLVKTNRPVLLLGGGQINHTVVRDLSVHSVIVAVDGGGNYAMQHDLDVCCVIGDGDSLEVQSLYRQDGRFIHTPDQYSTDFHKALAHIEAPVIVAAGFLEDRLDHALSAINTAAQSKQNIVLVGRSEAMIVVRQTTFSCAAFTGMRVSVCPLQNVSFVSSQGLLYPLDGIDMAWGGMFGTSNAATGKKIAIQTCAPLCSGYVFMLPWQQYGLLRDSLVENPTAEKSA